MKNDYYWDEQARLLLAQENTLLHYMVPRPTPITLYWRGGVYLGSIQENLPGYDPEVIVLKRHIGTNSISLVKALRRLDPERLELIADNSFMLGDSKTAIARRINSRVREMTQEQLEHASQNPPSTCRFSIKDVN